MGRWTRLMVMATMVCPVVALSGGRSVSAGNGAQPSHLEFLGQAIVPTGTTFGGTVIGGLSSITYDPALGVFYSLSDDQSQTSPRASSRSS